MSHKQQVPLKTINLDWTTAQYNSSSKQLRGPKPKGSFLLASKSPHMRILTANSAPQGPPNIIKRESSCSNPGSFQKKLEHIEINRSRVERFLVTGTMKAKEVSYQHCSKRPSGHRPPNAFRFFLNSAAAFRNYCESIESFQKMHIKITELGQDRPKITRPSTGKPRLNTQPLCNMARSSASLPRRKNTGVPRSATKREKCLTSGGFEPWETVEEKFVIDW